MSVRNLDKLFKPRAVALIGATPRHGSLGAVLVRNLRRGGFGGPLMLVNPHHRSIDGVPVYPDVASLPEVPDLAVIATPPETVSGVIAGLGARGTRAAIVITAGLGERGTSDRTLQQAMLNAAQPHLLRVVGPSCAGIMVPAIGLDASFSRIAPPAGDLAFISQSGGMITAVLDWAAARDIGFSHVVSLGDMADVDFGDMLDYLAADPGTRAILLYIETITHPRKFMSAARAAARNKPVIVVKAGRFAEATHAATSHTGALAGVDAVYDAAFRRAGVIRVTSMAELFDTVETLALTRAQQGDRLAILTNGGGPGSLAADALIAQGGELARLSAGTIAQLDRILPSTWSRVNPIDIIDHAAGQHYADALSVLLGDRDIDAILVLHCPTALAPPAEAARAVIDTLAAAGAAAPEGRWSVRNVFTAWLGERSAAEARRLFAAARIPTYDTPDSAVRGFMHRVQYRRNQELLMQTPAARPTDFEPDVARARSAITSALGAGRSWLDAGELNIVFEAHGIPSPVGPTARLPDAIELIIGIFDDPIFGPVVMFGHGGTAVEQIADTTLALPPLNQALARALMARTRVWRLLQGYRGRPAAAIDAVAEMLIRVAQVAVDHPEIRELEINPLLAGTAEVIAVDARLRVTAARPGPARLAISPYPRELEVTERLRDGTVIRLRPIRPEDEPLLQDLAMHMSPQDLRLRFFSAMRGLSHQLAARLTQIDYDREMALIAFAADSDQALGVSRFAADPDNRRAEYAIEVRGDWKGRGLGYLLMIRLIEVARGRGISEMVGEVLRENAAMLQMCRALGFTISADPNDPSLVQVSKALQEV